MISPVDDRPDSGYGVVVQSDREVSIMTRRAGAPAVPPTGDGGLEKQERPLPGSRDKEGSGL